MKEKKKTPWIMKAAIIIGVLVIPLLYSYFYLGAFWDPYARLDDVPVAVVNLDSGAVINGEERNLGQEICDNLEKDGTLKFVFTDKADAEQGVLENDYYASITIPKDFSSNASTASKDTEKLHSSIVYTANQKKNYLAAQILENAMPTIKQTVNSSIDKEIITTLCDKLESVPDSMGELQNGFKQLSDGSGKLSSGTNELADGADKLSEGSSALADGSKQVSGGAVTLLDGIKVLDKGANTLNASVPQLADGVQQLTDGSVALRNGTTALNSKIPELSGGAALLNNGALQLSTGLDTLKSNSPSLTAGAQQLNAGATSLKSGIQTYTDGVSSANSGAVTLANGIDAYTTGVESASAGANNLYNGINQANEGLNQIVTQVQASSQQLEQTAPDSSLDALSSGASQVYEGIGTFSTNYTNALNALKHYQATGETQYLNAAVSGFEQLENSLPALKSGAQQVSSGVTELTDGMKDVKNNTSQLLTGLQALQSGFGNNTDSSTLLGGAYALNQGLSTLKSNNNTLNSGAQALKTGLNTLNSNSNALNQGANELSIGASTLSTGINSYTDGVASAADGAAQLKEGTSSLTSKIPALTQGVNALDEGAGELSTGLIQLNSKVPALSNGVSALADGSGKLLAGADKLSTGAKDLSVGTVQLDNGIATLRTGAYSLNDGATQLDNGISTAKDGVDESITDTNIQLNALDGLADYAEEPISTVTEYVQPVENYGSAFAPYFMCLSLWVGGLMIYFGIYLDYNRKIKSLTKDSNRIILRTLSFGLISMAQGVLLAIVIKDILHIVVNNPLMLFMSCILVSLTFMTIIQFCIINLGDAGKFVSLLLLILQLTSCAGTFPIETQSGFFRVINKILPMTYSTQLFKEAISGTAGSNAGKSAIILAAFFVVFLALTLMFSHSSLKKDLQRIDANTKEKMAVSK